jgi:PhnB protein
MKVEPYLSLDGRCEEAIEFYKRVMGAEVLMMMRFKDSPQPHPPGMLPPGGENKIMHASLQIGGSRVMASDGNCGGRPKFEGISLAISVANDAQAQKLFAALSEGGKVQMPLTRTFFSSSFGMVADRFGVSWMIVVEQ